LDFRENDSGVLLKMKDEAFEYQGQRISFSDGYSDVNNNSIEEFPTLPVSEVKICNLCVVQLESAYVFKRLCQEANRILRQKYSLQDEASASDHIKAEQIEEETTEGGADTLSFFEISTDSRHNTPTNVLDIKQKKHECKLCLKVYKCRKGLNKHNQHKHSNRKFPCDLCDKIFNCYDSLFYHKKSVHLKIRHKCGNCSKIFTSVNNLALHIKSKHMITRHMKNEHLNAIKYHTCKICNKRYVSLSALWHHSFQHRGFKPFKCTACDYTNVCKLSFKQHLRKRHQIIYNELIHGYKKETFSEVLKFVWLENKK
jgi:hypothetical protein